MLSTYSVAPSTPSVGVGTFNLPLRIKWAATPNDAFIVPISSAALLYANAAGGHTWSGEIVWEER